MKPSAKPLPQKFIENAKELNITDEYLSDFMEIWKKNYMPVNAENKSYTNITNSTFEVNPHQAVSCDDLRYCDSEMRHFFEEYKHYHGYVSLIVSTFCFYKSAKVLVFQTSWQIISNDEVTTFAFVTWTNSIFNS